jgi:hypothetical protein
MEPAYRDRIDDLIEEDRYQMNGMRAHRQGMQVPGLYETDQAHIFDLCQNVKSRLAELDREGIAAELLIAGTDNVMPFFFEFNKRYPADLRAAGTR